MKLKHGPNGPNDPRAKPGNSINACCKGDGRMPDDIVATLQRRVAELELALRTALASERTARRELAEALGNCVRAWRTAQCLNRARGDAGGEAA